MPHAAWHAAAATIAVSRAVCSALGSATTHKSHAVCELQHGREANDGAVQQHDTQPWLGDAVDHVGVPVRGGGECSHQQHARHAYLHEVKYEVQVQVVVEVVAVVAVEVVEV